MSVSNIGSPAAPPLQPTPTPAPAPAAKNDHDGDDGASPSAALPKGQGTQVDTKA